MDMGELARLMIEWEDGRKKLDQLESKITAAVLEHGKTVVVGNVAASYSKGRTTYDYAGAGMDAPKDVIQLFTVPDVDWKGVCSYANINPPILKVTEPSVTVKIKE